MFLAYGAALRSGDLSRQAALPSSILKATSSLWARTTLLARVADSTGRGATTIETTAWVRTQMRCDERRCWSRS